MRTPVFALSLLFLCSAAARAEGWLDSAAALQFRDRVVQLALIYGESNGIDPQGFMVRTRQLRQLNDACGEVEVLTFEREREVRREIVRACRAH